MTWYAHQIFAQPHVDVILALRSVPGFAKGMYHIPHLREMETEEQIVGAVIVDADGGHDLPRTVRSGPQLPPEGMLVVRELCSLDDDSDDSEWFGEDAVPWNKIGLGLPPSDSPILETATVFANAPDWWPGTAPPIRTLLQLQEIAISTRSTVAYYTCHMWGGDVECVYGWVWDGERRNSCFYRGIIAADENGHESTGFFTDLKGAYAIDRFGRRLIANGDVLTLLLLHFDLLLSDGYFELHTRSFPWNKYRMNANIG